MQKAIQEKIQTIEKEHNITILYACESGSRAWGFVSPDSDYDVRFIYAHPLEWYLSIADKSDTLIFPMDGELDFGGWEVRKSLDLFRRTNAVVYEWLQSPIVYYQKFDFQQRLLNAASEFYHLRTGLHHYLGMISKVQRTSISNNQISIKKYFYLLRPLLAALWIVEKRSFPPMNFYKLLPIIKNQPRINKLIQDLLAQKAIAKEGEKIALIPELQDFIQTQTAYCGSKSEELTHERGRTEVLDKLVLEFII